MYVINSLVLKDIRPHHNFDVRYEGPFRIINHFASKAYLVQHIKLLYYIRQVIVDLLLLLSERRSTV